MKKIKTQVTATSEESIQLAYRYLKNAKQTIGKTTIEYGRYTDTKYVSEAAGIAYLASLKAIDSYLLGKGIKYAQLPKSIEGYRAALKKHIPLNGKLWAALNTVYENLHILAYYRSGTGVGMVKEGFQNCKKIIDMLDKTKHKEQKKNET